MGENEREIKPEFRLFYPDPRELETTFHTRALSELLLLLNFLRRRPVFSRALLISFDVNHRGNV